MDQDIFWRCLPYEKEQYLDADCRKHPCGRNSCSRLHNEFQQCIFTDRRQYRVNSCADRHFNCNARGPRLPNEYEPDHERWEPATIQPVRCPVRYTPCGYDEWNIPIGDATRRRRDEWDSFIRNTSVWYATLGHTAIRYVIPHEIE